jgi:hypothetical protein
VAADEMDQRAVWRTQLEHWLRRVVSPQEADGLFHHLGDIRDSCQELMVLLSQLPTINLQASEGRELFASLYGEMFEHLQSHLSKSKPAMQQLLKESFRTAEERGEL